MANIFCSTDDYESREHVEATHTYAPLIVEVEGGWLVFDTLADYETWGAQQ
jgi:hypothetical protein